MSFIADDSDLSDMDRSRLYEIAQARLSDAQNQLYERLLDLELAKTTSAASDNKARYESVIVGLRKAIAIHRIEIENLKPIDNSENREGE